MEDVFQFINNPDSYTGVNNEFVARIYPLKNVDELYNKLYTELKFPNYFGFSWNALDDCLTDLDWIDEKKITLVHDDCNIDDNEFETYISVLYNSILIWRYTHNSEKILSVIFPVKQRQRIDLVLTKLQKEGELITQSILLKQK